MEQISDKQCLIIPMKVQYLPVSLVIKKIVETTHFLRLMDDSLSRYPFFLNDLSQCEIGCEFSLFFEDRINILFRLESLIETDFWTHVVYFAYKTEPSTFQYKFVINVHYVNPSTCVILSSFTYPKSITIPNLGQDAEKKRRLLMFKNIETQILKKEHQKFNIEYIVIKAKMSLVWELLKNLKTLTKLVKLLSDDIEYEGKEVSKGKKVVFIYNLNKKISLSGEGSKLVEKQNECELEFFVKEIEREKVPEQRINLLVYGGQDEKCIFYMFNRFNIQIEEQLNNDMSNKKKIILKKFKKIIENYVTINNNQKNIIKSCQQYLFR